MPETTTPVVGFIDRAKSNYVIREESTGKAIANMKFNNGGTDFSLTQDEMKEVGDKMFDIICDILQR